MAKVLLEPIGRDRDAILDDASYLRQREVMEEREQRFVSARADVVDGWGDK